MGKKEKDISKKNDLEDRKLQAILLADSFKNTFRPMTLDSPKALMPLVNVPMIMYTIEFLAQNGVDEIFIFCVKHTELMEKYIAGLHLPTKLTVRCITSSSCLTQGDALREIDSMNVIRSDPFIVINGDVISNMNLSKAIDFHKEKRSTNPNAIMTVVMKEVTKHSGLRPIPDDLVVALDSNTSQLVLFDNNISASEVNLPKEVIFDHNSIDIRTDLLDCQIDICSPELLLQFSDNFDYQNIRKHFIQSEVINWELGQHLYAYIIQSEYAARVHDPRTYDYVSRDIINRWVFPMVPDALLLADFSYIQHNHFIYKENNVKIARSAHVGKCVVLGHGTVLDEGVEISDCVIGPNCIIGKGAKLSHCHLWENVVVEKNATIMYSIIGDECKIKEGATIGKGSLLSSKVVIGSGQEVPQYSRLSSKRSATFNDDDVESDSDESISGDSDANDDKNLYPYDAHIVGHDGEGYVWNCDILELSEEFGVDDDSDVEDDMNDMKSFFLQGNGKKEALWASSMGCQEQEAWKNDLWQLMDKPVEEDDSDDDSEQVDRSGKCNGNTFNTSGQSSNGSNVDPFLKSVAEWVIAAHEQNDSADNLLLEIKGLKFAQNKTYVDCIRGVVPALLNIFTNAYELSESSDTAKFVGIFKSFFDSGKWGYTLIHSLVQDETEELCVIECMLDFVLKKGKSHVMYSSFRLLLHILYDVDILREEVILQWGRSTDFADDEVEISSEDRSALIKSLDDFFTWLEEDDEEDDDSDDDDEEDDDGDDSD